MVPDVEPILASHGVPTSGTVTVGGTVLHYATSHVVTGVTADHLAEPSAVTSG